MTPTIDASGAFFWIFTILSLFFALAAVLTPKVLRAAVYLTVVLVGTAAFYVLLAMEFLAGVQILVYVGGIVILIVFAVMLTSGVELVEAPSSITRKLVAALCAISFFLLSTMVISSLNLPQTNTVTNQTSVHNIGKALLDLGEHGFVVPFEVISLLLLSVFVGSIVIARKEVK